MAPTELPTQAPSRWGLPRVSTLLRVACGLILLGLLAWQASTTDGFSRLLHGSIDAGWLAAALALLLLSLTASFARWWLVARAARLSLSLGDAFRYGAIGFAANFVALGNVGGDLVKAALLAHGRPGKRAVAVSTVLVDRLLGLFVLLLFASCAIGMTGTATLASDAPHSEALRLLSRSTLGVTLIALLLALVAIAPGRIALRLGALGHAIPGIGPLLSKGALLADRYREGRGVLLGAVLVGLAADGAFLGSFYAMAQALPMGSPPLVEHLLLVPLAMIAGALPISPSGLGTVEAAVELLYQALGDPALVAVGDGSLVAFGHRLLMLAVGGLAVLYYFGARSGASKIGSSALEVSTDENVPRP